MVLNGIGAAGNLGGANPIPGGQDATPAGGEPGAFDQLLAGLSDASGAADAAITDLAIGGETDIHDVVLAAEMESIAFDLAVQIRNRLVDAYQEIFRMQV